MKALFLLFMSITACAIGAESVGTHEILGKVEGVEVELLVQSPSAQATPLQIVCAFEYTEGDINTSPPALPKELNGMVHVDSALNGLITDLRKSNKFEGKLLETLLIISPPNTLPAKKLLMIGLGKRTEFTPEIMRLVGLTGMREALRLGVTSYSHASDLKDAGISSPTAQVAGLVVQGALDALRTQKYLQAHNASSLASVSKVTVLCGPDYFADSKSGIMLEINNNGRN